MKKIKKSESGIILETILSNNSQEVKPIFEEATFRMYGVNILIAKQCGSFICYVYNDDSIVIAELGLSFMLKDDNEETILLFKRNEEWPKTILFENLEFGTGLATLSDDEFIIDEKANFICVNFGDSASKFEIVNGEIVEVDCECFSQENDEEFEYSLFKITTVDKTANVWGMKNGLKEKSLGLLTIIKEFKTGYLLYSEEDNICVTFFKSKDDYYEIYYPDEFIEDIFDNSITTTSISAKEVLVVYINGEEKSFFILNNNEVNFDEETNSLNVKIDGVWKCFCFKDARIQLVVKD
ncbi:MAG: hypothetical protein R3Y43_03270 [Alphaproteobacteria bacterium]